MKTLSDYRVSSDVRNWAYQPSLPGNMMRVSSSFLPAPGRSSTCYVIIEEQPPDALLDNNGNDHQDKMRTSINRGLSSNKNINDGKNNTSDNVMTNDNTTFTISSSHLVNLNESVNINCDYKTIDTLSYTSSTKSSPSDRPLSSILSATAVDVSSHASSLDPSFLEAGPQPDTAGRSFPDVKSGHLVLIVCDNISMCALLNSDRASPGTDRPQRCPVIVKICGNVNKYAIISSTRRHRGSQSVCLKLKHSHVTQSSSNPSRFTVFLDGDDGKTFTFEAGSSEVASDWTHAFSSSVFSPNRRNGSLKESQVRSRPATRATTHSPGYVPVSSLSTPPLNLTHMPLMPALSESLDEADEE